MNIFILKQDVMMPEYTQQAYIYPAPPPSPLHGVTIGQTDSLCSAAETSLKISDMLLYLLYLLPLAKYSLTPHNFFILRHFRLLNRKKILAAQKLFTMTRDFDRFLRIV